MSITGTGTQADPYIVTTWSEIASTLTQSNVYVKLGNDIDMNDSVKGKPEGVSERIDISAREFDGNGHAIKNLYSKGSNTVFFGDYGTLVIKNLNILNAYVTSTYGIIESYRLTKVENCLITAFCGDAPIVYAYNANLYMENCSIVALGTGDIKGSYNAYLLLTNCDIQVRGNNSITYAILDGTRITTKDNGVIPVLDIYYRESGGSTTVYTQNSVIDATITKITRSGNDSAYKQVTSVINSNKLSGTDYDIPAPMKLVTTEQMADKSYLQSIGFTIV